MGLFDKIKKKESEEVQTSQVETVQNIEQAVVPSAQPVEGSQSFVTEVSIDNNPFVEEVTPVEEVQVASSESAQPSFDNIFNATPGDLVMPSQPNVVEEQENGVQAGNINDNSVVAPVTDQTLMEEPAINIVEQSFPVEENQADEITQLVSEAVAATENAETIPGPTFEQNIAEVTTESPVEAQQIESPVESQQVESPVEVQQVESPVITIDSNQSLEQVIEPDTTILNEGLTDLAPVELISEPTIIEPVLEAQELTEVVEPVATNEEIIMPNSQVQVEIMPEENAMQNIEIMQENITATNGQTVESEIILVDEPIENLEELEPTEMAEPSALEEQVIEPVVEVQPEENNVELSPTEPVIELVATDENINQEVQLESVENVPVIEEINSTVVPEEVPVEQEQTETEVSIEPSMESSELQEETQEIQDISQQEAFIPEEIAASQNDIIELVSEPSAEESNSDLIMLTDEPVAEMTTEPDLTQLIPEETTEETEEAGISQIVTENSEETEISPTITEESEISPIIEEEPTDIVNNEIIIPEIEESFVEEASTEDAVSDSNYYSDININTDINEEQENSDSTPIVPVIEIEEPVIELNIAEESAEESNEEENDESKVEEVEEKPIPVITEEEPVLNLGDESSTEEIATPEMEEEQSITPIIEEESNDIRLVNENDEYNIESNEEATIAVEESEEPVIMLSNDNTDTEEITPFEPSFEVPQISEETPEEVEVESEEGAEEVTEEVEDISVPEFDFQSFMMTNDNDNGLDYENPTVVESQTETATYISDPTPTKFCSNCGVMLTDESSICPSCGEPID